MNSELHKTHFQQLHSVRESWCNGHREPVPDRSGVTIELQGNDFADIPGFYLALGHAVNGESGYFGACLHSLSDCLCGGFGLVPPFRLILRNTVAVKDAFRPSNVLLWELETLENQSQLDEDETHRRLAGLRQQIVSPWDYLRDLLEVLESSRVQVEFAD